MSLELAMLPKLDLEVSPALVQFGELLMLPYAEMRTAIEDELQADDGLERIDGGECPVCGGAWSRCPVCGVPSTARVGDPVLAAAEGAAAEADSELLLRAV